MDIERDVSQDLSSDTAIVTVEPVESVVAVEPPGVVLLKQIKSEAAYRDLMYEILAFSVTPKTGGEIEEMADNLTEGRTTLQSPLTLVSWLAEWGALIPIVEEGKSQKWQVSETGAYVVNSLASADRLTALMNSEDNANLLKLLTNLTEPKSRQELEDILGGDKLFDEIGVYPSYFIGLLEEAGGIEWNGKWRMTKTGMEFLGKL
jgi:hypothetical protein